jgi:hypothetical protein
MYQISVITVCDQRLLYKTNYDITFSTEISNKKTVSSFYDQYILKNNKIN